MNFDRRWFMVELRIDRYHRTATIIPDNLLPEDVQYIEEAINSEDYAQESNDEPINLDTLVPDINYCTTPLSLDDPVAEEEPGHI
jgi:hypothetical protein